MTDLIIHHPLPGAHIPAKLVKMTHIIMNPQEQAEKSERDERHADSLKQDRNLNYKIDAMAGKLGDLTGLVEDLNVAITGNKLGNPGLLPRVEQIEKVQREMKNEFEEIKADNAKKQMYLYALLTLLGFAIKSIIDLFRK